MRPAMARSISADARLGRRRLAGLVVLIVGASLAIVVQLFRLAAFSEPQIRLAAIEPLTRIVTRPDIVDRRGRLLATDVVVPSLYADPALVLDVDEAVERLVELLPDLDAAVLRAQLADRTKRFVWIRRGLPPRLAQAIHDLGVPGLALRSEPRRIYPQGGLAGHVIGHVGIDNQGLAGLERTIDETLPVVPAQTPDLRRAPVRLTLDIGVQFGVEAELADAVQRFGARGAAAVLLDVRSGGILAASSLPRVDPQRPQQFQDPERLDRLSTGTYELGSIFKALTIAMALEQGIVDLDTVIDVRAPLKAGPYTIKDLHPQGRPLSVRDVFLHSSNVGAGMIALQAGSDRQQAFLEKLGLAHAMRTEAGPVAPPRLPSRWGRAETITIAYGHGLAVAPLQFAGAAAALVNGGRKLTPTFRLETAFEAKSDPVISQATSRSLIDLLRRNVVHPKGTGRRADVSGLEIGGKTGTAELPGRGGYQESDVISSFLATWPVSNPKYMLLLMIFEPKPSAETAGQITAGMTAAPAAGRLVARVAPLLVE